MNSKIKSAFIIFAFTTTIILANVDWNFEKCNVDTAKQAITPILSYEQTMDGPGQHTYITRFLHNKAGVFMSQFTRCYFQAVDPFLLYKTTSIVGLIFFYYLIYNFIDKKKHKLLLLFLSLPLLSFFNLPVIFQIIIYKILAITGVVMFIKGVNAQKP